MKAKLLTGIVLLAALLAGAPRAVADPDPRDLLRPGEIESVSIHLNAAGANLGFEAVIDGASTSSRFRTKSSGRWAATCWPSHRVAAW